MAVDAFCLEANYFELKVESVETTPPRRGGEIGRQVAT